MYKQTSYICIMDLYLSVFLAGSDGKSAQTTLCSRFYWSIFIGSSGVPALGMVACVG